MSVVSPSRFKDKDTDWYKAGKESDMGIAIYLLVVIVLFSLMIFA